MLSHEDYYNMKYILKDKKITLKYISGTWVHWFFAINEHREEIERIPGELPWEIPVEKIEKIQGEDTLREYNENLQNANLRSDK